MRLTLIHTSIHDPREGSDPFFGILQFLDNLFQSTLPIRGAIGCQATVSHRPKFQSTLPIRGAILFGPCYDAQKGHFNPRSPHGERFEVYQRTEDCITIFQSTLPSRGAIFLLPTPRQDQAISIHAPLAGSDFGMSRSTSSSEGFQSTLPSRGAIKYAKPHRFLCLYFNPRSPHGERSKLKQNL